jgi:hypothetical protein
MIQNLRGIFLILKWQATQKNDMTPNSSSVQPNLSPRATDFITAMVWYVSLPRARSVFFKHFSKGTYMHGAHFAAYRLVAVQCAVVLQVRWIQEPLCVSFSFYFIFLIMGNTT